MASGSCLCGAVAYTIDEPLDQMTHCHCSMCRKAHGSLFATYLRGQGLHWQRGEELVVEFESSPGFVRSFCSACGSVLPEPAAQEGSCYVAAGGLDTGVDLRPESHIFAESKADFYDITDDLPRLEGYGADANRLVIAQPPRNRQAQARSALSVGGSCLCGDVTFQYQGTPELMMNCHCSRCRKVKGAAHASNVFISPEHFEWLSGEDKISRFDLPLAARFGNSFCQRCGSSVPRLAAGAPMINIPAGSLDDDPGIRPSAHIFTDSMADWFSISDNRPQHDQMPNG